MKKIESSTEFKQWIDKVNMASMLCDLQDEFAHTKQVNLLAWFMDMTQNEKEKAIFSIQKAMGSSNLFVFIKEYVNQRVAKQYEIEIADLDIEREKFEHEKYLFEKEKEDLKATILALQSQNGDLINDNDTMQKDYANTIQNVWRLEKEVEELSNHNNKLLAFESHIKSLLAA